MKQSDPNRYALGVLAICSMALTAALIIAATIAYHYKVLP